MNELLNVNKELLPKGLLDVIEAKKLVAQDISISDACKMVGISRATYYKYQDKIFESVARMERKAELLIKTLNEKGILALVLNQISLSESNILTINQGFPMNNMAYITIMLDISKINIDVSLLVEQIKSIKGIKRVEILSLE